MEGPIDLSTLPSCPKTCLQTLCSLTDLACICQTKVLEALDNCVQSSCSTPEAFYTCKYAHLTCKVPVRDQGIKLNVLTLILGFSTGFVIISRILFKRFLTSRQCLEKDDWTIMSAIPTGAVLIALVVLGINRHGLGNDIWGVSNEDFQSFGNFFFAVEILYMVLMTQIKLSLCFFYLNIFPGVTIRRCLWATVLFHILSAIAFVLALLFGCTPLDYSWTRFDLNATPLARGSCGTFNAGGWVNSIVSVVTDLWLIAIPLTQVGRLNLHIKKKIGIVLMFLTGALVTIVSILRLNTMKKYNNTPNPTWDEWDLVWWSAIEICTGFHCTSLPAMRLILIRMAPRIFGSERTQSQDTPPRQRVVKKLCSGFTIPTISDYKDPIQTATEGSSLTSKTGLCEETELVAGSTTESARRESASIRCEEV